MYTEINSENAEAAGASGTAATTQEEEVVEGQEDGDVTLVEQGAYHYIQTFSLYPDLLITHPPWSFIIS